MARKKVNLQWIDNDLIRQDTFKKRCNALMKKMGELSTLCGIKVALVVYGEDEARPQVYPSVSEARRLLTSFKAMPDHLESLKKILSQEDYLRARITKLQDQIRKSNCEKREDRNLHLLHTVMVGHGPSLANLTTEELLSLNWLVEKKIRNAEGRLEQLVEQEPFQEPLLPSQEQPMLSSQQQVSNTNSEVPTLEPVEEPQPQQQGWLADLAWSGEELGPLVHSDWEISNDGAGPSTGGGDIMQNYNFQGSGFPWSPDPFLNMEYGGCFDYSHIVSYDA